MRLAAGSLLITLFVGCSSIPDVIFRDADDAGVVPVDASDGGAETGSADASLDVFEPSETAPPLGCPKQAPAAGGVCCGSMPCVGCNQTQCERCLREGCTDQVVCCQPKQGPLRCAEQASCIQ
jgi:hypothetical protein